MLKGLWSFTAAIKVLFFTFRRIVYHAFRAVSASVFTTKVQVSARFIDENELVHL